MKRDNEKLRNLLLEMEAHEDPLFNFGLYLDSSMEDQHTYYHLRLLTDADLLEETGKHGGVFRMKSQGHDFLENIRSDQKWAETKAAVSHLGGISVKALASVAEELIRQKLVKLGLLGK